MEIYQDDVASATGMGVSTTTTETVSNRIKIGNRKPLKDYSNSDSNLIGGNTKGNMSTVSKGRGTRASKMQAPKMRWTDEAPKNDVSRRKLNALLQWSNKDQNSRSSDSKENVIPATNGYRSSDTKELILSSSSKDTNEASTAKTVGLRNRRTTETYSVSASKLKKDTSNRLGKPQRLALASPVSEKYDSESPMLVPKSLSKNKSEKSSLLSPIIDQSPLPIEDLSVYLPTLNELPIVETEIAPSLVEGIVSASKLKRNTSGHLGKPQRLAVSSPQSETIDGKIPKSTTNSTKESTLDSLPASSSMIKELPIVETDFGTRQSLRKEISSSPSLRSFIQKRRSELGIQSQSPQVSKDSQTDVMERHVHRKKSGGNGYSMDLTELFVAESPGDKDINNISESAPRILAPVANLANFQESLWIDFGDEQSNIVGQTRALPFILSAPTASDPSFYYSVEIEKVPFKKGFNIVVDEPDTALSNNDLVTSTEFPADVDSRPTKESYTSAVKVTKQIAGSQPKPTVLFIRNGESKRLQLLWTPTEGGGVREVVHLKLSRGRLRIVAHGKAREINNPKASKKKKRNSTAVKRKGEKPSNVSHLPPFTAETRSKRVSFNMDIVKDFKIDCTTLNNGEALMDMEPLAVKHAVPIHDSKLPSSTTPGIILAKSSPGSKITTSYKSRRSIIHDDSWADKQCASFAKWLNYVFYPVEDMEHELSIQSRHGTHDTGSMDRIALRTLLVHRRRAQSRKKGLELYKKQSMQMMRYAIEVEVTRGRLSARKDRDVFADLGLRNQMVSMLMSYSSEWLRLGLETVFGEIILDDFSSRTSKLVSNSHQLLIKSAGATINQTTPLSSRKALKEFIITRVLSDPATTYRYTKGKVKIPSGKFETKYREEIKQHALRLILLLVAFLDQAKGENVLESDPRLFTRKGIIKSSKQFMVILCRDYLAGEGDIIKHLSNLGLNLSHKQKPIEEFDFTIKNLAVDLRDGVRLTRMVELLTASPFLLGKMRVPAGSRLQKLHNVGVALSALNNHGVQCISDIQAHHIVDGHRESALLLLWSVMAHFKLNSLLDTTLLKHEIENVTRANKIRRASHSRLSPKQARSTETNVVEFDERDEGMVNLLLKWCQAVCSCFGYTVENFTTSFSNGKALCYLIHYYHPGLLRLDEICMMTQDIALPSKSISISSEENDLFAAIIKNEQDNSALANSRILELGGVPGMLPVYDSQTPPEEKSMILSVAYLCSRLMESSNEIFASIVIQTYYRKHRKIKAAISIFTAWRRQKATYFLARRQKYKHSVHVIESFTILYKKQLKVLSQKRRERELIYLAATKIQAFGRLIVSKTNAMKKRDENTAATLIQTRWRTLSGVQFNEQKRHISALLIQNTWRSINIRAWFVNVRAKVLIIQCAFRRCIAQSSTVRLQRAIVCIQRNIRRWLELNAYEKLREARVCNTSTANGIIQCQSLARTLKEISSATSIQSQFRQYVQKQKYLKTLWSTLVLQTFSRRCLNRNFYLSMVQSSVAVQRTWRGFVAQLQYHYDLMDIILVQSIVRCQIVRKDAKKRQDAALKIQCFCRSTLARVKTAMLQSKNAFFLGTVVFCQSLVRCRLTTVRFRKDLSQWRAILALQSQYRCHRETTKYTGTKASIVMIQSLTRGHLIRSISRSNYTSACVIQSIWRGAMTRTQVRRNEKNEFLAAALLQSYWRGYYEKNKYKELRSSVISIQAYVRGKMTRLYVEIKTRNATAIQCVWRKHIAQTILQQAVKFAVIVQSQVRRRQALKQRMLGELAVSRIQQTCRQFLAIRVVRQVIHIKNQELQFNAAIAIQSVWRASSQQAQYKILRARIILVQSIARSLSARVEMKRAKKSATRIQSVWRGFTAQLHYQYDLMDIIVVQGMSRMRKAVQYSQRRRSAILSIQRSARVWFARCEVRGMKTERAQRTSAAIILQSKWRANRLQKKYFQTLCHVVNAQSLARLFLVKRKLSKLNCQSTVIQRHSRGYVARTQYEITLKSIVVIQSTIRQTIVNKHVALKLSAISTIQHATHQWLLMKRANKVYKTKVETARFLSAVVRCQSFARRSVAIKNFKHFSNIVRAVTLIQSNWRCASVTRAFQRSLRAAMILQSWARAQIAKKLLIHRRQELFKWEMERTNFAATEIQKVWRGYVQNVDFILLLLSAIKIQTQIRSSIKHKHFTSFKSGIVQLQALVRGHATKSLIAQKEKAAICIQAFIRGTIQKAQHRVIQSASILVQSALRGYLTRIRLELEDFAATEIQRIWRGYDVNVDFLCMSLAAIRIQAFARRVSAHQLFMARKSYRLVVATAEGHFVDRIAEKIQRTFRRFIYRRNLSRNIDTCQRIIRGFLAKSKIARLKRGILVLQSICRGNSVRITMSKKVRNVARRIARANKRAIDEPEMKLGVRTFRALQVLQKSKKLSEIMKAMLTLEVSTRLSKRCCGSFAHARAPDILYGVVRTCNRSLPHIELLNHLLLTLRNVARHDDLLEYVASSTSMDVLLDLVQMFRDKDIIFVLAVTLLEQVAFSKYEYMSKCCLPENVKRLKGIYTLCSRKTATLAERNPNKQRVAPKGRVTKSNNIYTDVSMSRAILSLESILACISTRTD